MRLSMPIDPQAFVVMTCEKVYQTKRQESWEEETLLTCLEPIQPALSPLYKPDLIQYVLNATNVTSDTNFATTLISGPPENTMQRYMTVHVTCQNHVGYMTFNISDMHFDMSEHFEHVVCHDSTCNLPCSTTNEDVFAP